MIFRTHKGGSVREIRENAGESARAHPGRCVTETEGWSIPQMGVVGGDDPSPPRVNCIGAFHAEK